MFVSSGCRDNTPQTGRLTQRGPVFPQSCSPRSGVGRLASPEAPLLGLQRAAFSHVRGWGLLQFLQGHGPSWVRAHPTDLL